MAGEDKLICVMSRQCFDGCAHCSAERKVEQSRANLAIIIIHSRKKSPQSISTFIDSVHLHMQCCFGSCRVLNEHCFRAPSLRNQRIGMKTLPLLVLLCCQLGSLINDCATIYTR